jgi:tripartite-type tricarboxylate transporter receptor subunit TctC
MKKLFLLALICLVPLFAYSGGQKEPAAAQTPEEFYKNRIVTLIVNGGIGGGTDFASRLVASYWSQVTGGAMIVKVMSGGGGIEGLNYVYHTKPDGLTIGATHHPSDMTAPKLMGTPGPDFDTRTLSWIGFFGFDPSYLWLDVNSQYKILDDLKKGQNLKFGGLSPASTSSLEMIVAINILGIKGDVVFGYEGVELGLATKRGEIAGYCLQASSGIEDVNKGFVRPFCSMTLDRRAWYPETPAIAELVKISPQQTEMLEFIETLEDGKSFYGPPGISADKLNYLRRSFDKIMVQEGFLEQVKVRWPIWEKPMTGEELEADVKKVLSMPLEKITAIRELVQKYTK